MMKIETNEPLPTTRERVLRAAADLLTREGRGAVSTRAVSAAAGVQPPTLYRLFGDMDGLLQEVVSYGFEQYLAGKYAVGQTDDPLDDLRRGWDVHVEFGLARPTFYVLMYAETLPGRHSQPAQEAAAMLRRMIGRLAAAGRLKMSVDRATQFASAAGTGLVLSLISTPPEQRDLGLPAVVRETVLAAIATDASAGAASHGGDNLAARAVALRALLGDDTAAVLTDAERNMLAQWLDRLADGPRTRRPT